MLLQKLKDYRKAVKELTKASKADPKNPQVHSSTSVLQHGSLLLDMSGPGSCCCGFVQV